MSEKGKLNMLIFAVLLVIVSFTVLEWAAFEIGKVDVSTIDNTVVANAVRILRPVLMGAPVAIAIGFGVNLRGFLAKWLKEKRQNEPHSVYSFTWFSETIVKFEGFILVVTPFIEVVLQNAPPEYKSVAMVAAAGIFAIFKIALSELKGVLKDIRTSDVIPTPGMPPP